MTEVFACFAAWFRQIAVLLLILLGLSQAATAADGPPTAAITAPTGGNTYLVANGYRYYLTVTGTGSSTTKTISQMDVLVDDVIVSGKTSYSASFSNGVSLVAGSHKIVLRATDSIGRTGDSAPINVTVNVDTPRATMNVPTGNLNYTVANTSGTVNVSVSGSGSSQVSTISMMSVLLDGSWLNAVYTSSISTSVPVGVGTHTLQLVAEDNTGNYGYSNSITIKVDAPPTASLSAPANNTPVLAASGSNASVNVVGSGSPSSNASTISSMVALVDGGVVSGTLTSGASINTSVSLAPGNHTIQLRATDSAGLTALSAVSNVSVDAPPSAAVSTPSNNANYPVLSGHNAWVTLIGSGTSALHTVTQMDVLLDGAVVSGRTVSGASYNGGVSVPSGSHTLQLRATDNVGRTGDSSPVNVTVTVDVPTAAMSAPTANATYTVASASGSVNVTVSGSGHSNAGTVFRMGVLLDGNWSTYADASTISASIPVPAGTHTLQVVVEDNAGNYGYSNSVTIKVDAPPTVAMTAPVAAGTYMVGSGTVANVAITGSAGSIGNAATVSSMAVLVDGALVSGSTTSGASINTTLPLALGNHTVQLKATDSLGQTGFSPSVTISVAKDFPTANMTAPTGATPYVAAAGGNATVNVVGTGATSNSAATVANMAVLLDGSVVSSTIVSGTSVNTSLAVSPGRHTLQLQVTDDLGVTAVSSMVNIVVQALPSASISSPVDGANFWVFPGYSAWVPLVGSGQSQTQTISQMDVLLDGNVVSNLTTPGANYNHGVSVPAGSHTIQLRSTDDQGRTGVSGIINVTVKVDAYPSATLSAPSNCSPSSPAYQVAPGGAASINIIGSGASTTSTIASMAVLLDGNLVNGSASAGPNINTTVTVPLGLHQIVLQATDSLGQNSLYSLATPCYVNVDSVPVVTLGTPANGVTITAANSGTANVTVSGNVRADATNFTTSLLVDGKSVNGGIAGSSITTSVPLAVGSHTVQLSTLDEYGLKGYSGIANVTVTAGSGAVPVVTLSATPLHVRLSGPSGSTMPITFSGSAAESGGSIATLALHQNTGGGYAGAPVWSGSGGTLAQTLNLGPGNYGFQLTATDPYGNSTDSAPVVVSITDSSLLGEVSGVQIAADGTPQLVGWVCQSGGTQALSYSVYLNAPVAALGGTLLTNGVASVSGQSNDVAVQSACGTNGVSHNFTVDLSSYTSQYGGAQIFVNAYNGAQDAITLPCSDNNCTMPGSMRIGLSTPANGDQYVAPATVFMRALITGSAGPFDEVAFSVDGGSWMAASADAAPGAYFANSAPLAARSAPYSVQARVRQGNSTVYTLQNLITVNSPPAVQLSVNDPASAGAVVAGSATTLSAVPSGAVGSVGGVTFYVNGAPVGAASQNGTAWTLSWTPTAAGTVSVVAKAFDSHAALLSTSNPVNVVVKAAQGGAPGNLIPVAITPPTLPDTDAGTLPGALDVGPGGDANYSIALVVPPGTAGVQPSLSLNYSSSGGNGIAGLGWSLSGLSSIHRCGKTIAQDGVNGRINFDTGDRLCLDGERLVLIGSAPLTDDSYWADGAVFRTEIDSFVRVTALGTGSARTFKVERKDGKIMTFGDPSPTVNARVLGYVTLVDGVRQATPSVRTDAQSWALDKMVDRSGNFITFHYTQSATTGEHVIDAIRYGGNGLKPHAMVKFSYEDRSDTWTRYIDGTRHDLRKRIKDIATYVGDDLSGDPVSTALVRDYALSYVASPTSGRSLLKQVQVSATNPVSGALEQLPATVFDWGAPDGQKTAGFVSRGVWNGAPVLTTHATTGYKSANHPDYFAFQDMENHGLTDVLQRRVASPGDPAYNENPATAANPLWPGTMQAQYDYFHNNGTGFDHYTYQLDTQEKFAVLQLGDFDGDGAPDLLVATASGASKICLSPLRNGVAGLTSPITFTCAAATDRPALGANTVTGMPYVVDVLGDGRSAIYGDISANTHTASLYLQQEQLVDTDPPYAVLPLTDDDRRNTISDPLQTYVSLDQSVDFAGIGKHADVRWALPYHTGLQIADNGEPVGAPQWVNLAPTVTITDFRRPGSARLGSVNSFWLNAEYPAPLCLSGATPDGNSYYRCDPAPYRFDAPMPTGGAVADFSGSGYSNLMFGFVEITKQSTATRAEATLCLSTGRELDCGKLPQHSGDQYKVVQAIGNFVGDGAPSVLMQETRSGIATDGTKLAPVAVGGLQMCRMTGMGNSDKPSDIQTSCVPWSGLTLPGAPGDTTSNDQVYFMDLLGTGRMQAVYYHAGKFVGGVWQEDGRWEVLEPADVAVDGQALDRIYQVTNGLGAVSSVEYHDGIAIGLNTAVFRGGFTDLDSAYPQRVALSPGKVVTRLKQANGIAGQHATSYRYFDPATDVAGRGALGFGAVESTDEQSGIITTTKYSHVWPKQGMVRDITVVSSTGVVLAKTTNTLGNKQFDYASGGHSYWPFVAESKVERHDLDKSDMGIVTTDNTYDDYGELTLQHAVSTGGGKTFIADVASDFLKPDSIWVIGLPTTVMTTRTDPDSGTLTRKTTYEYDPPTGLLTKSTVQPGEQLLQLVTEYLPAQSRRFGLVEETKQTWTDPVALTVRTRSVKTSYDDKGRFAMAVTNAANLTENYDYVPGTGARKLLRDANQLATTWDTDGFGRVRKETRSDGNETRTVLKVCDATHCPDEPDAAVVQLVEHYHGLQRIAVPSLVYSDSVGHVLRTQSYAFDGSATYTKRTYDERGRLKSTTQPAYAANTSPAKASSQNYDDLNRVTATTVLDEGGNDQTTTTQYSGLQTVLTNAKHQSRTDLHNVIGQVWQVTDAMAGVTSFAYDPFGNLNKTVDPRSNVITVEYDKLGRRTALNDPDLGRIEYTVDAPGRVRKQTTQVERDKGQSTESDYDMLDRMTLRKEADLNAGWTYDSATNGNGQLAEAFTLVLDGGTGTYKKDYDRVHTYDSFGRPASTVQTLSGGNYTSTVSYDDWGRVLTQQYQRIADAVKQFDYRYNDKGYLSSIERNGLKLWSVSKQDAANRPTQVALGNGLTQVLTYNVSSARLTDDQLMLPDTTLRLDQGYAFDPLGNVTQRTQYWDKTGFIENFNYDDLNRLKDSTVTGQPQQVFNYFADGSLRNKTGVGTGDYAYPDQGANAQRPHAVQSIAGGPSFSYDNNGNMLSAGGMTVSWNSFDMPKTISKNGNSSTFIYGPEHERVRQDRGDGTTIIYAGAQEVETSGSTVTVRTYWPMGIGLETDVTNQPTVLNWIHKDRLGSPVALTAQDGTIAERLAYDAWGQRRDIGDRMDNFVDHRGFTGHEMLDQLDLVHMNGRVYDPVVAKFLSGDPLIQDPTNGQNYNRYSYVLNNPTNLTDPTGFAPDMSDVKCAMNPFCNNQGAVQWKFFFDAADKVGGEVKAAVYSYFKQQDAKNLEGDTRSDASTSPVKPERNYGDHWDEFKREVPASGADGAATNAMSYDDWAVGKGYMTPEQRYERAQASGSGVAIGAGLVVGGAAAGEVGGIALHRVEGWYLQRVTNSVVANIEADAAYGRSFLSAKELANGPAAANFGKVVERAVAERVAANPLMKNVLEYTSKPFRTTPDFVSRFGRGVYDITTKGTKWGADHLQRGYEGALRLIEYVRPNGFKF